MRHFTRYCVKASDNFENIDRKVAVVIVVDRRVLRIAVFFCAIFLHSVWFLRLS